MDTAGDDELTGALRDFVARIGAHEAPGGNRAVGIEVRTGGGTATFAVTPRVAGALAAALRAYHDPHDRGRCERCGGVRLDENLICIDCGHAHGIFGDMLRERAARYDGDPGAIGA
jgi:hypothetical protein